MVRALSLMAVFVVLGVTAAPGQDAKRGEPGRTFLPLRRFFSREPGREAVGKVPAPSPPRLGRPGLSPAVAAPDAVLRWNELALQAVRTERTPAPRAAWNLAVMHTAIYDAVNGILRTHQVYQVDIKPHGEASPEAAAVAAAHTTLVEIYPLQKRLFDSVYNDDLERLAPGPARDAGLAVGVAAARGMLAVRARNRLAPPGSFQPRPAPGSWMPTPPDYDPALLPDWGRMEPLAFVRGPVFRFPGPPPLNSEAYAHAFQEVKSLGRKEYSTRTPEQTEIAWFWADGPGTSTPPGHWNHISQTVALDRGQTLAENARLFALLNLSMCDVGILCWWSKFTFVFWRPVTAIAQAASDDNPQTQPDARWLPLLPTPPFPAYTSGHSSFSAAAATVLAEVCGSDQVSFRTTSEAQPGVTRSFTSFWAAAEEAGLSRIYGGIHWSFDNRDGLACGRAVARAVTTSYLLPAYQSTPYPLVPRGSNPRTSGSPGDHALPGGPWHLSH